MSFFDRFKRDKVRESPNYYGDTKTIHQTGYLDVETHNGVVVAVWYRCKTLPFQQHEVTSLRAQQMFGHARERDIRGIEFESE